MVLNPEFRRYCWLELTPHRLIAAPLIAGLILVLVGAAGSTDALSTAGLIGFAVCALAYGGFLAMGATPEEVRERTWDFQRMSALTPSQLAFGKVFGAPVVGWYAGAWFLAAFILFGPQKHGFDTLLIAAAAVFTTVALHATAVILGTLAARAGMAKNSGAVFFLFVIWTFAIPVQWMGEDQLLTQWWGLAIPRYWFFLVSSMLFAGWAWMGAARTFAVDLRVRQLPWAWLAFCLFLGVWGGGLLDAKAGAHASRVAVVLLVFLLATGLGAYALLLSEKTQAITVKRVLRTLAGELEGGMERVLQSLPLWSVSLCATWVAALLLLVAPWSTGWIGVIQDIATEGKAMPLALAAMLTRDAGLYCIFALARFPRRPATATIMYLVLLDGVLPGLMGVAGLKTVSFLVFPLGQASALGALAIFLVQAAVTWTIAWWRWSEGQKTDLTT